MTVGFLANANGPGITIVDRIDGRRFPLTTPREVAVEGGTATRFREPVDATISCQVRELELPHVVGVLVRDGDGEMVAECHDFAHEEFPEGEYELEIAAPIKVFIRGSGPVTVSSTGVDMRISFADDEPIEFGARSYHERPAATVTTTAAPEDLMAAVSTFGSALKTTSPERSFPSLRGHPPTIELGDDLVVPERVAPPDTGLQIEVPGDRAAVYAVATLAHYLGARVTPGEEARLLADGDVIRPLDGPDGIEGAVTDLLKRVFLLDCIVRTEGRYQVELYERRRLDERVDLPLRELYEASIVERIQRYLDVSVDTVSDLLPTWSLSTHLSPSPASAEVLSYAANALSLISVERPEALDAQPRPPPGYDEFVRSANDSRPSLEGPDRAQYSRVQAGDTLERVWFGDGRSVNANDLQLSGIRHRLAGESTEGPIDIALVCNEERMNAEVGQGELYGDRKELPFEVTVHRNLSRDELRAALATDLDFLHYVGHVDRGGFICHDGALGADELETVGVDTFLLNGCRSYDQGSILIEKGSIGGIVTHGAVENSSATTVGRLVAGLLNAGFSLRSALAVIGRHQPVEGRYAVIGDGGVQVAQSENGTPTHIAITRDSDSEAYTVQITTYPSLALGMGACYTPYAPSVAQYSLVGGELSPIELSLPEVVNLLALERVPTLVEGEFRWSTDVLPADLP